MCEEKRERARRKTVLRAPRKMTAPRQISLKAPGQRRVYDAFFCNTGPPTQCPRDAAEKSPIRPHISLGDKRLPDDDGGKYSGFGDTPDRRFIAQLHLGAPCNNSAAGTKRNCTSRRYLFIPSAPNNENMCSRICASVSIASPLDVRGRKALSSNIVDARCCR